MLKKLNKNNSRFAKHSKNIQLKKLKNIQGFYNCFTDCCKDTNQRVIKILNCHFFNNTILKYVFHFGLRLHHDKLLLIEFRAIVTFSKGADSNTGRCECM